MRITLFLFLLALSSVHQATACSILYYKDPATGKIYAANNEDYWYDVKPYLQVMPSNKQQLARLWYGWNDFAQGGINSAGLFFDGASTPEQPAVPGYAKGKGNTGDAILASCRTVKDVLAYIEQHKIAYTNAHLLFGDSTGHAVVIEWVNGKQQVIPMQGNELMITNFLLSDTSKGNYPCPRYNAMKREIERLHNDTLPVGLKETANIAAKAIQFKATGTEGKEGGTLYSTFINITDMQFVLMYRYDNSKLTRLDLRQEFAANKKRKIKLE